MIRFVTTLVLVLGVFIAPWWSVGIGLVLCIVVYRHYAEALIPGVMLDILYGAQTPFFFEGFITVILLILLIISISSERYFRNHVRL